VALHYYYTPPCIGARLTRYRNCKFHNGAAALSAGTLMASAGTASAGTPYRLVPAHFYP